MNAVYSVFVFQCITHQVYRIFDLILKQLDKWFLPERDTIRWVAAVDVLDNLDWVDVVELDN